MLSDIEAPEHFICPLTMEIMVNPVKNVEIDQSFSKSAIYNWMFAEGKSTCPLTRKPISPSDFIENRALAFEIEMWKNENQIVDDEHEEEDEEDDDELCQQALENAKKIQEISRNKLDCPYLCLMELGNKVLQQRDQGLKEKCPTKRRIHIRIPSVVDIFALYQ